MSEPTITPTRPRHVLGAGIVGYAAALLGLTWWQGTGGSLPIPGAVTWASVLLLGLGIAWLARRTRVTVREDRSSLPADQAVTRVLLGKASQVGGAFLGGAYLGLVSVALPGLPAPLAFERFLHGGLAALASVGWAVAGHRLEVACRVPPPEDPDTPHSGVDDEDRPG